MFIVQCLKQTYNGDHICPNVSALKVCDGFQQNSVLPGKFYVI